MKHHVVVIGAGYGGIRVLERLTQQGFLALTLIDQNSYHYLQPEVHEFIAGKTSLEEVAPKIEPILKRFNQPINFIQSRVEHIDFEYKTIIFDDGETLDYNTLVIATGATTWFPDGIEGIHEHCSDIKTLQGALHYRHQFEEILARYYNNPSTFEPTCIVVGGAGLSGVEIICEMAAKVRHAGIGPDKIAFSLVEPMESVLPGLDPFLIKTTQKRLDELKVEQLHGYFINHISATHITLNNGECLRCELFIFTGGIAVSPPNLAGDIALNKRGQFMTDTYGRLAHYHDVFVLGDTAQTEDSDHNILPPTSQVAKQAGNFIAENIIAQHNERPLTPYRVRIKGVMIALGGEKAAGVIFNRLKITALPAFTIKKLIFFLHGLSLRWWKWWR